MSNEPEPESAEEDFWAKVEWEGGIFEMWQEGRFKPNELAPGPLKDAWTEFCNYMDGAMPFIRKLDELFDEHYDV